MEPAAASLPMSLASSLPTGVAKLTRSEVQGCGFLVRMHKILETF